MLFVLENTVYNYPIRVAYLCVYRINLCHSDEIKQCV